MALGLRHVTPELLTKVTKTLGITSLDQWYYVSHKALLQALGVRSLNKFGGISNFLKTAYPLHKFDDEKLVSRSNQERDQNFFEVVIRKLFPNTEIQIKARKSVGIINPETDAYLEIDFWLPSLKLGIEFQDKHHYGYQWYANDSLEDYQKRDSIKKAAMSKLGYTLINIGFWWDKSLDSVAATIRKFRPDLLQEYKNISAEPISPDPPLGFTTAPIIPDVAGIMSPFVPSSNFNPTNWYASEKYDGIRGIYHPKLNKMFSRSGRELSLPSLLLKDIPNTFVEGEITAGRGNYTKTAVVSYHSHYDKVNWSQFRYLIFDIPDAKLGNYTMRYSLITRALFTRPFIFAQSTVPVLIVNKVHLKMLVDAIFSDNGEGVAVQKDAQYEYGRATSLAKIKVRRDADAQILQVSKHSCICKLPSGATADIPFFCEFNPSELKIGDIISFYHNGFTQSGTPKQAEVYKVRFDVTWEMLVSDISQSTSKRRLVREASGGSSLSARNSARNKMGYWNKPPNARAFFDEFAKTAGFDSLVPENWYPVRINTMRNAGGASLFKAYSHNFKKALSSAYPELKFQLSKFRTYKTDGHWKKSPNARAFFDEFARTARFNPLLPENWYKVTTRVLRNAGV